MFIFNFKRKNRDFSTKKRRYIFIETKIRRLCEIYYYNFYYLSIRFFAQGFIGKHLPLFFVENYGFYFTKKPRLSVENRGFSNFWQKRFFVKIWTALQTRSNFSCRSCQFVLRRREFFARKICIAQAVARQ
jgi:hypothetical protein